MSSNDFNHEPKLGDPVYGNGRKNCGVIVEIKELAKASWGNHWYGAVKVRWKNNKEETEVHLSYLHDFNRVMESHKKSYDSMQANLKKLDDLVSPAERLKWKLQ